MKNLTAAIFLTLLFVTVSAISGETADGFNQNPEYILPAPAPAKPAEKAEPQEKMENAPGETDKADQPINKNQTGCGPGMPGKNRPQNPPFIGSLWEDELKNWERRNSPLPQNLPHATLPLQRQSFPESNWDRTFRSSSPRIRRIKKINRIKNSCRCCRKCN